MLDSGKGFQTFVHAIEQGKFAPLLKSIAAGVILLAIILLYLFVKFSGFGTETAMDQAQIARNLASGKGFSTNYIRPLALWQLDRSDIDIPETNFPDISQPPLFPALSTIPLSIVKGSWKMDRKDIIYTGDRAIATMCIVLFLAAVGITYFVARRLFDAQLALFACILMLLTDIFWQFSLSGLSHMLLLVLFMSAVYMILSAMESQENAPKGAHVKKWLLQVGLGLLFGLMTLTNWLACWFFIGYLFFAFFFFRPRVLPLAAIAGFAITLTPWIIRNMAVCGHPFGLALYPMGQELLMRSLDPDFSDLFYGFKNKFRTGILSQMGQLLSYLGLSIAGAAFFLALFHPFKRKLPSRFRWCVVTMWLGAVIGMASYGPIVGVISEIQLHTIFLPVFMLFGLAFLLVLWNRLGLDHFIFRAAFHVGVALLCAIPMLLTLFAGYTGSINWPPYVPPYIAILGEWFEEDEGLCSDMPWAVAWYANRKCLLLPESPKTMVEISDYEIMGVPIRGLYLTPVSGDAPFLSEIATGDLKSWSALITRNPQALRAFPLSTVQLLPIDGMVILFADRDRWSTAQ